MAPLSFLKSSSASSPARRSDTQADAQARTRSPSPEPTGSSRYNPARLLRRKPSTSQRQPSQPARTSMDSQSPMPGMVSATSEVESSEQETEGPQTASSAFFSDIGDHHAGPSQGLAGRSDDIREGGYASPSRILGSPRSKREGGIWSGGGTNLMDTIPDISTGQAPPSWLGHQASQPASRRIMDPSELLLDESALPLPGPSRPSGRPSTPPSLSAPNSSSSQPFYPTALSPPRRPMGKSPQPTRSTPPSLAPALATSSSFSAFPPDPRPCHTSSPSIDSAQIRSQAHPTIPFISQGIEGDVDPHEPKRPVVTAEWLARKPSSSRLGRKNSKGGEQSATSPFAKRRVVQKTRARPDASRQDSDTQSASQDSDAEVQPGKVGKRRSISTRDGFEIEVDCDDTRWPGDEDDGGEMIWRVKVRRLPKENPRVSEGLAAVSPANASSPLHLSKSKSTATAPATASSINLSLSLDQPTGKLVFIAFPMDLHATPKRRGSSTRRTSGAGPPTPPLPPSPRDLFSAGSESRSNSNSTPSSRIMTPPPLPPSTSGPSTPPPPALPSTPQSRSASRLDRPEYPVTPTRVRLSGQFSPPPGSAGNMSSPRSRGASSVARSLSPAFSNITPGSVGSGYMTAGTYNTPTSSTRRTKLVNVPDLEGGLYARGTVDGLSEELEGASLHPR